MTDPRMDLPSLVPDAIQAVLGLEKHVRSNLDHGLLELLKLRASTMNGCAHCVDMHATSLVDAGEDVRRVVAVAAWRESPFFTERERVVLELTEAVTRLGEHGVPDDVWAAGEKELGQQTLATVIIAIATINVWNRIAISTRAETPPLSR